MFYILCIVHCIFKNVYLICASFIASILHIVYHITDFFNLLYIGWCMLEILCSMLFSYVVNCAKCNVNIYFYWSHTLQFFLSCILHAEFGALCHVLALLFVLCCQLYALLCVGYVMLWILCYNLCAVYCAVHVVCYILYVIGMLYIVDCMLNIFHCLMLVVIYAWFISIGQPFNFQIIYYSKVHNIQLCLICWALCIGYQISQIVHRTSYDAGLLYVAYCIMDMVVVSCMILLYPVSSELHVVHCSFHKF